MPNLKKGDKVKLNLAKILNKKTKPPSYYNENINTEKEKKEEEPLPNLKKGDKVKLILAKILKKKKKFNSYKKGNTAY